MSHIRSIDLVEKYLENAGCKIEHIPANIEPAPISKVTLKSGQSMYLNRVDLVYPFAASALIGVYANKQTSYLLMANNKVPVPFTRVINNDDISKDEIGQELLHEYGVVVVKPINGRRSIGLTTNIRTEDQLRKALTKALKINSKALVQEQFLGEEARFIVLDGNVKAVLLRQKPFVTGNGIDTVEKLIHSENVNRSNITSSMVTYPMLDDTNLPTEILHSQHVPTKGERVELSNATMIKRGASVFNIISSIHSSYIEVIEKIAQNFGKGMFVVDLMSKDFINKPAKTGNYIFLEFNLNAALVMCYSCRDGNHFNILEDFLGSMIIKAIDFQSVSS